MSDSGKSFRSAPPSRPRPRLAILGGGVAGLAAGYFAKKKGIPFAVYEARDRIGGNCVTYEHGGHLFDSGAHRFHDQNEDVTGELTRLLGSRFQRISVPSRIYHQGRQIDFPLSPLNLIMRLGPLSCAKIGLEILQSRLGAERGPNGNFEHFALRTYGKTLSARFLLNYTEKLWGIPCSDLSQEVSKSRMRGLTLMAFLKEAFLGKAEKTEHLDGSFYYPLGGIGEIPEVLADACGKNTIFLGAPVTKVLQRDARIRSVVIDKTRTIDVDEVLSTLPLSRFVQILEPAPPEDVLNSARNLSYRQILLVALFLNKKSVTRSATVYFPAADFLFSRVYEPKNRSDRMSSQERTSLVAEIPCSLGDETWRMDDDVVARKVRLKLIEIGWIRESDVEGAAVHRLHDAYPVLSVDSEDRRRLVFNYLAQFRNLKCLGRTACFQYLHIHDLVGGAKAMIEDLGREPIALRPFADAKPRLSRRG